jgi:hypothetical protein
VTLLSFILFAFLALVGPGLGLQRALRLRPDPALFLPLGLLGCAASYALALFAGQPWIFFLAMVALNAPNVAHLTGFGSGPGSPAPPGPALRGALWPWLTFVAMLLPTQFPWNRPAGDGSFLLDPIAPYDDAVFHVGLARELTLGLPPQVPGLSGVTLGYHLGQGLVRAAALRFASVSPFDLISRVDPVLLSLGLILLLRSLAARLGLPPLGVALAGWSVLFTDLSFVFAGNPSASYWADLLKGNLLLSLAYVNPVVPGLLLALGTLLALARFEAEEGQAWLVLAALQAAALPHFKVFLGAHLVLGLAVAAVFAWRDRSALRALVVVAVPCALMTALLALGQGGAAVGVTLAPFDLARVTRQSLDLPPAQGFAFAGWCVLWLLASLGLRWLGVEPAWTALRTGSRAGAALAAMALTAWPLGLAVRIAVKDALPDQKVVNDAAYIVEQGGPLLWLFTAAALAGLAARRGRVAALCLVGLATLPSTLQFVVRKAGSPPDRLPLPMVRAVAALGAAARPGDVVLQRPAARYPPAPVLLATLRVPYERYTPFRTQFASMEFLERRHEQVFRFFRTEDPEEARAIARDLGVTYLALYGPDRVRFDPTGVLEPIFEEEGARVFRIHAPPP